MTERGKSMWCLTASLIPNERGLELIQSTEVATLALRKGSTLGKYFPNGTPDKHARPPLLAVNLRTTDFEIAANPSEVQAVQLASNTDHIQLTDKRSDLSAIAVRTLGSHSRVDLSSNLTRFPLWPCCSSMHSLGLRARRQSVLLRRVQKTVCSMHR